MFADELFAPDFFAGNKRGVAVLQQEQYDAVAELQGGFDGVVEAGGFELAADESVDDRLDIVLDLLVERGDLLVERDDLPVDAGAHEAVLAELVEDVAVFALAAAYDGREDHHGGSGGQLEQAVADALRGLGGEHLAAFGAVGRADVSVEQAEIVVNLRDGRDRGARIGAGGALFDGDGRGKSFDMTDFRLAHAVEELAGVGGEAFDVAALSLGVERVERERGLAGAGKPGDDGETVTRDRDVDVFQVMFGSAVDDDVLHDDRVRFV